MAKVFDWKQLTQPEPEMVQVWRVRWTLIWSICLWGILLCFLPLAFIEDDDDWLGKFLLAGLVLTALIVGVSWVWAGLTFDRYRFAVKDEEVLVTKGVLFITRTTIPFARIQNINVVQGPIMRYFGLQSVSLETAGASYANVRGEGHLAGLSEGYAEEVADALMELVKRYKAAEGL